MGELVISGCKPPPVLEATEHALDDVALFVGLAVKGMLCFAGGIVGDHRHGPAFRHELPQCVAVIGGVGGAELGRRQRPEQANGRPDVSTLSRRDRKAQQTAERVGDGVDFGGAAAAGAADGLGFGPPFPPAAERWALAEVESIAWKVPASNSTRASNISSQIPLIDQRR